MKYLDVLRKRLDELSTKRGEHIAELEAITSAATSEERSALNATEEVRFTEVTASINELDAEIAAAEARFAELEAIEARQVNARKAPVSGIADKNVDVRDVQRLGDGEARSRALSFVEKDRKFIADEHRENLTRLIERRDSVGAAAARIALVTGTDAYERGWSKYMSGNAFAMSEEERTALSLGKDVPSQDELRAMTSGTGSSGGYLVPVFIDPTMVITGAGSINPIRQIATVKTIGPAFGGWYGATAAQVTAAWTAEGSAAPDNTPTVTQPNIPVYMAEAFVAVSYQAFEDVSDLAGDVLMLFADAKANLEATAHQTGTGSSQPTGIVTAVTAITASRVSPATGGAYAIADAFSVHTALPARFRGPGSSRAWLGNVAVLDRTRSLTMAQNSGNSVWTDISGSVPSTLLGDAVYEASQMDSSFTTGQNILLYGDFSRYYVIDRIGFTTEFIPNLFDTSTGRPTAQRGWMSHWRTGANAVDTNAFRVLKL